MPVVSRPGHRCGFGGRVILFLLRLPRSRAWNRGWGVWSIEGSRLEKEKEPGKDAVSCQCSLSQSRDSGTQGCSHWG